MPDTKMKRYGFYAATALIVAVGMMIMWPLGSNIFAGGETPARELQNEVRRTHNQAQNLDESLGQMIPVPPDRQAPRALQGRMGGESQAQNQGMPQEGARGAQPDLPTSEMDNGNDNGGTGGSAPNGNTITGGPVNGGSGGVPLDGEEAAPATGAERPTPRPDKYDDFANPADQLANDSRLWMYETCLDLECPEHDQYVAAVSQLHSEWDQRYQEAIHAHKRFAWRINRAKTVAHEYFEVQAKLTESMPNRQRRQHYRQKDQEEREIFRVWQTQADEILAQSNIIMDELRQMNIELNKQVLSAQFASVYRDFEVIPIAITNLHYDLESFRIKSRELEARFGPAAQQQ